jgi:hypothetical protein
MGHIVATTMLNLCCGRHQEAREAERLETELVEDELFIVGLLGMFRPRASQAYQQVSQVHP